MSMESFSFALPSLDRCERPTAASLSALSVHPGRLLHGPDPKLGFFGFTVGLAAVDSRRRPSWCAMVREGGGGGAGDGRLEREATRTG